MKPETLDRVNGWMAMLRVILPVMVTIMLFWLGNIQSDIRMIQQSVSQMSNEVRHDIMEIKQRLSSVEAKIGYLHEGKKGR